MERAVVALFRDERAAEGALSQVVDLGVPRGRVSLIGRGSPEQTERHEVVTSDGIVDDSNPDYATMEPYRGEAAATGASSGAFIGGLTGLFAGISTFAIPGAGPVIVAGSLAATLGATLTGAGIGAVAGGLIGALVGVGIPEEHAHHLAARVHDGQAIAVAHVEPEDADRVARSFAASGAEDIHGGNPALPYDATDDYVIPTGVPASDPTGGTTAKTTDRTYAADPTILGAQPAAPAVGPRREPSEENPQIGAASDGASASLNASTNIAASQPGDRLISGATADQPLTGQIIYGNTNAGTMPPERNDPNATTLLAESDEAMDRELAEQIS